MSERLASELEDRLVHLAHTLIDQQAAEVVVAPLQPAAGYWFGGGNLVESADGVLYLVGRYRNEGDSRTGIGVGERGLRLSIFASEDSGASFHEILRLSKAELAKGGPEVLSIEGTAIRFDDQGVELFVSSEKAGREYPPGFESYRKPGTGICHASSRCSSAPGGPAAAATSTCWQRRRAGSPPGNNRSPTAHSPWSGTTWTSSNSRKFSGASKVRLEKGAASTCTSGLSGPL